MEILSLFALGFAIKFVTGIDDILTRIPVIVAITRTRKGKIAFSSGAVLAVAVATGIAYFAAAFIQDFPGYRIIVATLIFLLALCVYFKVFAHKTHPKTEQRMVKMQEISKGRFIELFIIGFVASFATVLDDIIAFLPIFFAPSHLVPYGILGILTATVCGAILVVFMAEKIDHIPYKEKIAAAGLVVLGTGILLGYI